MGLAFSAGVEALLFVGVVFMAKSGNEATTELSGVVDGALEDLAEPLLALVLTTTALLLPLILTADLALDFPRTKGIFKLVKQLPKLEHRDQQHLIKEAMIAYFSQNDYVDLSTTVA